jgi:hypothetical protein
MNWAIYVSQLWNPLVGMTGAIPLALGVLKLPTAGVAALVIPANLVQVVLLHYFWQWLLRRPRIAAWIEARRSPRVAGWLDARGAFIAAVVATIAVGSLPTYISLRFLGAPFVRIAGGVAIGCAMFGGAVTVACKVAGM